MVPISKGQNQQLSYRGKFNIMSSPLKHVYLNVTCELCLISNEGCGYIAELPNVNQIIIILYLKIV